MGCQYSAIPRNSRTKPRSERSLPSNAAQKAVKCSRGKLLDNRHAPLFRSCRDPKIPHLRFKLEYNDPTANPQSGLQGLR